MSKKQKKSLSFRALELCRNLCVVYDRPVGYEMFQTFIECYPAYSCEDYDAIRVGASIVLNLVAVEMKQVNMKYAQGDITLKKCMRDTMTLKKQIEDICLLI